MFGLPTPLDFYNFVFQDSNDSTDKLKYEKHVICHSLENFDKLNFQPEICKVKNTPDAERYRKQAHKIFLKLDHNELNHQNVCKLYTQSLALAPNDSEDLTLAYENRSALSFHLKKFEDCIQDCDRALDRTSSGVLTAKLKFRKIESLLGLRDSRLEDECEDTLRFLKHEVVLIHFMKNEYIKKIQDILDSISQIDFRNITKESLNKEKELPVFIPQKEIPCASESVKIKYKKKWGRHIVATRDIEPGEIIAIEKSYVSFIYSEGMYLHCSNCLKSTVALIPCNGCIYDVYCSEKCKSEAWIKYHEFECNIFPYTWDIDEDIKTSLFCTRFMLISVYKAGSIHQFRSEFLHMINNDDLQTKGFSSDGIFDSDKYTSANSLENKRMEIQESLLSYKVEKSTIVLYYLATKTNFFGIQYNESEFKEMAKNEDIIFIGAVLLYNLCTLQYNAFVLATYDSNHQSKVGFYGASIHPFCCIFNHSCDQNAMHFTSKNNELVVYAKYPIEKGSQVFISYISSYFLDKSKEYRQSFLKNRYLFTCECIACTENWTTDYLQLNQKILIKNPQLAEEMRLMICNSSINTNDPDANILMYTEDVAKELLMILKNLADRVTVYSIEYDTVIEYLHKLYIKSFGNRFIEFDKKCSKVQ